MNSLHRASVEGTLKKTRTGGDTLYNGLYGEAPPERGSFFRLQIYERVGIPFVKVYCKRARVRISGQSLPV